MEDTDTARVMRAALFAAEVHRAQRGKGAAADVPYVNHLLEVASLLADAGADTETVVAGLLHDTIEDSRDDVLRVTRAGLEARFGAAVAAIVAECTDDKSLPKQVRKAMQAAHAPHASAAARMVKLADKISNLRRLVVTPPDWDQARRLAYVDWSAQVVAGCRGVNAALEAEYDRAHGAALSVLAPPPAGAAAG